jgi:alkylation response protein AidB-like acyl-CoA dehydrogenase
MPDIYGIDGEGLALRKRAAEIADGVIAKHAADVDARARFPEESIRALGEAKLHGLCVPAAQGGLGQGPAVFAAVVEEVAQRCATTAMVFVMHVSAAKMIEASTTLEKKDAILGEIARGQHLTTLALSERGSRSQFWAPVSKLVKSGNGFKTSAFKSWSTSAHNVKTYVSSAQMPGASSPAESTLYLLPRDRAGVRVAGNFDGLGLRGNDSAPVSIEDAEVSTAELITEHGKGGAGMLEVILPWFNVGSAAMANGLCLASVAATQKHLSGTGFEHTGSQLRDLPTLRAKLAEMSMKTELSRALLGHTLAQMAAPSEVTPLYVLHTRLAALKAAVEVTDLAMQCCGGAAFSKHLPLERNFRDARAGWVMAPTVDHLQDFVGRALTGLPLL